MKHYLEEAKEVLASLDTTENGLTSDEANARLETASMISLGMSLKSHIAY